MRLTIDNHKDYEVLSQERCSELIESAKQNIRVGFEIELSYKWEPDDLGDLPEDYSILQEIQRAFESQLGFTMAIGKGECAKKKLKRCFSDGINRIEIPVEIDIDGYKEHVLIPYGYIDGSVPVELVTSPVEPRVAVVKDVFEKVYKIVKGVDPNLVAICLNKCGLHQTVVFDHLKEKFPPIVAANAIQITRSFLPGLFYLLSSGTTYSPTRSLEHRGLNPSMWRQHINSVSKYSMVFPRNNSDSGYWGIEFRYPDGTLSTVLPGVMAAVNTAIVMKAIKLSRFGVLKISEDYFAKLKTSIEMFTITSRFTDEMLESKNLIPRLVASELMQFLSEEINDIDKSAFRILGVLLEKPVWTRVKKYSDMSPSTYRQIDAELMNNSMETNAERDCLERVIAIDSSNANDKRNAIRRISRRISTSYAQTSDLLSKHDYVWSGKLAKFVQRE